MDPNITLIFSWFYFILMLKFWEVDLICYQLKNNFLGECLEKVQKFSLVLR